MDHAIEKNGMRTPPPKKTSTSSRTSDGFVTLLRLEHIQQPGLTNEYSRYNHKRLWIIDAILSTRSPDKNCSKRIL